MMSDSLTSMLGATPTTCNGNTGWDETKFDESGFEASRGRQTALGIQDDTISVFGVGGQEYDLRLPLRRSQGGGANSDFLIGGNQ